MSSCNGFGLDNINSALYISSKTWTVVSSIWGSRPILPYLAQTPRWPRQQIDSLRALSHSIFRDYCRRLPVMNNLQGKMKIKNLLLAAIITSIRLRRLWVHGQGGFCCRRFNPTFRSDKLVR